jgi:hypothetical protein
MHTLVPGALVIAASLIIPPLRVFLLSLGLAMITHVVRDAATSAVPALWPHAIGDYHLRYVYFLALLAGCATVTTGVVALAARGAAASSVHLSTSLPTHFQTTQPLEVDAVRGIRGSG